MNLIHKHTNHIVKNQLDVVGEKNGRNCGKICWQKPWIFFHNLFRNLYRKFLFLNREKNQNINPKNVNLFQDMTQKSVLN